MDGPADGDPIAAAGRALARIEDREPRVRAWVHLSASQALARASAVPSGGPLSGRTVGVKDLIDVAGMPTRFGSRLYAGHRAETDAAIVTLLEAAGACVLGKTAQTEFCLMTPGPTTNPHRAAHTPGGSSSGSAAAVASGMADIAVASQTYGSLIRPAGFCGVYGFKPTFGTVPTSGARALAPSFDTLGWYAASPDLLAAVYLALTGDAATVPPREPRIGVLALDAFGNQLEPEVPALVASVADRFGTVVEVDLAARLDEVTRWHHVVASAEIAESLRDAYTRHSDLISAPALRFLAEGAAVGAEQARVAAERLDTAVRALRAVFDTVDVVLTPSTVGEAPEGLGFTGDPLFCTPWTAAGGPALAVPAGTGRTSLPLGVQLVAAPGRDADLLNWAALTSA